MHPTVGSCRVSFNPSREFGRGGGRVFRVGLKPDPLPILFYLHHSTNGSQFREAGNRKQKDSVSSGKRSIPLG